MGKQIRLDHRLDSLDQIDRSNGQKIGISMDGQIFRSINLQIDRQIDRWAGSAGQMDEQIDTVNGQKQKEVEVDKVVGGR